MSDDKVISIKSVKGKPTLVYKKEEKVEVDEAIVNIVEHLNDLIKQGDINGIAVAIVTKEGHTQRAFRASKNCDGLILLSASTLLHAAVLDAAKQGEEGIE